MEKSITLESFYNEINRIEQQMVTKKELNEILETVEILGNPKTMAQIKASEDDIVKGATQRITSASQI